MAMSDKDNMTGLEAFFDAARAHPAEPSVALLTRIEKEARTVQAATRAPVPQRRQRASLSTQLFRLIGGWPALTGLATAAMAGVWLGVSLPEGLLVNEGDAAYLIDVAPELAFDLAGGNF
mgnify:CR=1 FL=1